MYNIKENKTDTHTPHTPPQKNEADNFCCMEQIPLPTLLNCDQSFAE